MFKVFIRFSCDICYGTAESDDLHKFPKGFKYFYHGGFVKHICPTCIEKGKDKKSATSGNPMVATAKFDRSAVIVDPAFIP